MTNKEKFLAGNPFRNVFLDSVRFNSLTGKFYIEDVEAYEIIGIQDSFFLYSVIGGKGVNRIDFNDLIFIDND